MDERKAMTDEGSEGRLEISFFLFTTLTSSKPVCDDKDYD